MREQLYGHNINILRENSFGVRGEDGQEGEKSQEFKALENKLRAFDFENDGGEESVPAGVRDAVRILQGEKKAVMEMLSHQLQTIDQREPIQNGKHARTVHQNPDGTLFLHEKDRGAIPITRGELLTDILWGAEYRLESDVSRELRREFATVLADKEISSLLDQQIALSESEKKYNEGTGRDLAYRKILEASASEMPEALTSGIIAEKMVEGFFRKMMIDHHLPFTIEFGTAYDDVEYKVDFIIHAEHSIGAKVEESSTENIGIQFTTETREAMLKNKKRQVKLANFNLHLQTDKKGDDITDIVLVTLPLSGTKTLYGKWRTEKRPAPGGPDKLWDNETKKLILRGVLGKIFSENALADIEQKVFQK